VRARKGDESLKDARILVVDDEEANVQALGKLLRHAGYEEVVGTTESRDVAGLMFSFAPDLLLLDLHMPHLDGFQVMELVRPMVRAGEYLPILILTGDLDETVRNRALAESARDFVTKPFEATEVLLRLRNLLETRHLHISLRRHNEMLEERVRERTRELADAQVEILYRLALAAEYRDDVTGQHAERVGVIAGMIARELGLPETEVALIRRAAPLHDVGKIGVPDAILMKPDALTPAEFEVMKSHVEIGRKILSGGGFPLLRKAREIAGSHHERWDGLGYRGQAGEEIPVSARITTVADVYDVITTERPYKPALPPEEAVRRIVGSSGSHFDPAVVEAFLRVVRSGQILEVAMLVNRPDFLDEESQDRPQGPGERSRQGERGSHAGPGVSPGSQGSRAVAGAVDEEF